VEIENYKTIIDSELFNIGPIVVFIWKNEQNWPVVSVSKNIENIYGHKQSDFLTSKLQYAKLIHEDDIQRVFKELSVASQNLSISSFLHEPYRLKTDNNSYKWVQDSTVILRENGEITHYVGYLVDITEVKNLQEQNFKQTSELLKNEAFFKSYKIAMDESSIVSKADLKGVITYVNDNFCTISGYTREEVIGKRHSILRHPKNSKKVYKELWDTIGAKKVWKGTILNKGKESNYWVDIAILPILDENDEIVEYIAVRHDITKMLEQQHALNSLANKDTLTGFGNRYKLNNDITTGVQPALAILNIDRFSHINDFYGHAKGDFVIQNLGKNIDSLLQDKNSKVYHLQGDEFVVFNKNTDKEKFTENIRDVVSTISKNKAIIIDDEEIYLGLSVGISFEVQKNILATADMALKIAKRENKNIVVYEDTISLNDEYLNNIKWTKKIKEAIERDAIVPVFQAIVNNKTGVWEKYESLVRIQDEDKLISPYLFLEISKKTKYYTTITKTMLQKSFENFKDLEYEFSLNLTIEDILDEQISDYICSLLENYKIGNRVVFEIVESESIENFDQVSTFIQRVKYYGCKIAIDDFGTGYSNFEYLLKLKADYIKIDGSMIRNIDTSKDFQIVISTIVDFATKLGIKTIAEFVENEKVFNKVKELGIDYSQGYYFSKPQLKI